MQVPTGPKPVPFRVGLDAVETPVFPGKVGVTMRFICNAFSLNMVDPTRGHLLTVTPITAAQAAVMAVGVPSAVGHAPTAAIFSEALGTPIPMARITVLLTVGEQVLVGQYSGARLEEGATTLPEGATIRWVVVGVCP